MVCAATIVLDEREAVRAVAADGSLLTEYRAFATMVCTMTWSAAGIWCGSPGIRSGTAVSGQVLSVSQTRQRVCCRTKNVAGCESAEAVMMNFLTQTALRSHFSVLAV